MTHSSRTPFVLATLIGLASVAAVDARAASYAIDPAHTSVVFRVDHLGMAGVFGRFDKVEGSGEFDPANPAAVSLQFVLDAASISTNSDRRDKHLRSPDFFSAAEFPEITFKSTGLESADGKSGTLTGDLTMLGVTKPVSFDVTLNHAGPHPDPRRGGTPALGISARGSVTRSEFGMKGFLPGVGDEIEIWIEVEALQK